jgi:hypothetical protein
MIYSVLTEVLSDFIVLSSLSYSIFGNMYNYKKNKNEIEKNIQELENETKILLIYEKEQNMPIFINPVFFGILGFMYPLYNSNNKTAIEEFTKERLCLLQNNKKNIIVKNLDNVNNNDYTIKYINNETELQKIYKQYNIDGTTFPVKLPLRVNETAVNKIYHNNSHFSVNKDTLLRYNLLNNRKPFTFCVLGIGILVVGYSWKKYNQRNYRDEWNYPIFHPNRYF